MNIFKMIGKFLKDQKRIAALDKKGWGLVGKALANQNDYIKFNRYMHQSNRIYNLLRK